MIGWRSSLLVCTLLALLVHAVVLYGVRTEMAALSSPLRTVAEPMFTRQITRSTAAPAPKPPTVRAAPTARAGMQTLKEATNVKKQKIVPKTPEVLENIEQVATEIIAKIPPEITVTRAPLTPLPSETLSDTSQTSTVTSGTDTLATLDSWPGDTRLSYRLGGYFRGDLHGSAQVQWTRQGALAPDTAQRYQTRISINLGLTGVQLTSQGVVLATGLQPLAYEEVLPGGRRRSMQVDGGFLVLQDGKRLERPAAALADMQDTASQFVALGHRFSTGRARLASGEVVRIWLARPGGLDEWVYDVSAPETLQLPTLGAVEAFRLVPRPLANPRGNITAQMWIAPSLQYLPVRIRIDVGPDTHVDLSVEKIEQR